MLTVTVRDYPARTMMAPHYHDEPSLIVVVRGEYLERIGGAELTHGVGHMLLYPAGAVHSQRFGAAGSRKIVFTPEPKAIEYLSAHGVAMDSPRYVDSPIISRLAGRMLTELAADDEFKPLALEGISLELVAAFARSAFPRSLPTPPAWLRAARDIVIESTADNLTLQEVADEVGRHPVHLAREFRRYYGSSIGEYRRCARLQKSEAMLRGEAGLTEIALACGFASHSHFSRAFKAAYGMTPSQFRTR